MKWNLIGIVRRHVGTNNDVEEEDQQGDSIDVQFHDSTFYHPIQINDDHGR